MYEICSKLSHWCRSGIDIVKFEQISHIALVLHAEV